jgi:hypothetical protein
MSIVCYREDIDDEIENNHHLSGNLEQYRQQKDYCTIIDKDNIKSELHTAESILNRINTFLNKHFEFQLSPFLWNGKELVFQDSKNNAVNMEYGLILSHSKNVTITSLTISAKKIWELVNNEIIRISKENNIKIKYPTFSKVQAFRLYFPKNYILSFSIWCKGADNSYNILCSNNNETKGFLSTKHLENYYPVFGVKMKKRVDELKKKLPPTNDTSSIHNEVFNSYLYSFNIFNEPTEKINI